MDNKFDTIILRFRDLVTSDDETINSHKSIIDSKGYVWWAWWKKGNESVPSDEFAILSQRASEADKDKPIKVFLVDSGQNKLYAANCLEIKSSKSKKLKSPEKNATPEYYSSKIYYAWFKLSSIEAIETDEIKKYAYVNISSLFRHDEADYRNFEDKIVFSTNELIQQERTVWFIRHAKETDTNNEIVLLNSEYVRPTNFSRRFFQTYGDSILWLSDLHFPKTKFNVDKSNIHKSLSDHINDLLSSEAEIGGLIVSGDISYQADEVGFSKAKEFLASLKSYYTLTPENIVLCPGNHDFAFVKKDLEESKEPSNIDATHSKAYMDFYKHVYNINPNRFFSTGKRLLLPSGKTVEIVSLNSIVLQQYPNFNGHGFISNEQLENVAAEMGWQENKNNSSIRIVVMHHHYLPTCYTEVIDVKRASSVVYDADRLMQWLIKYDVKVVLHGHKHNRFASQIKYPINTHDERIEKLKMKTVSVIGMGSLSYEDTDNIFGLISFSDQSIIVKYYRIMNDESSSDAIIQTIELPLGD